MNDRQYATDEEVEAARELVDDCDYVEIDDDARVSIVDDKHVWVSAWVWIDKTHNEEMEADDARN